MNRVYIEFDNGCYDDSEARMEDALLERMMAYDVDSVIAELMNEFNHEEPEWYEPAARRVIREAAKYGDLTVNVINRLFR